MADPILIHSFLAGTGEYAGSRVARMNPRRPGEPIVPAIATLLAPPETGEREAAVFDEVTGAWSVVPDWRGVIWWDAEGAAHRTDELGEAPPEGAVMDAPPAPMHRHDGVAWVPDVAAQGAAAHRAALAGAEAQVRRITSRYPSAEVASWPLQAVEARTVLDGGTISDDGLVAPRAAHKGRSVGEEAQRVWALAVPFNAIILLAGAVREAAEACLAATDADGLAAAEAALSDALDTLAAAVDAAAGG